MLNNMYIGARYIPKYEGEWSNTRSYEGLSVVKYQNDTYTSKGPVPVGVDILNTDYWYLSGSYNGYIANLQHQIDDMKNSSVSGSLQNQIDTMKNGNIDGTLQNQINDLNEELHGLNFKKKDRTLLFIGDSFTTGASGVTSTLPSRIAQLLNANAYYIFGRGSTGFVRNTDDKKFANQLQDAIDSTQFDNDVITDIIIIGGINDEYSTVEAAYYTEITSIMNKCSSFPNATVWVVPMCWGTAQFGYEDTLKLMRILWALRNVGGMNIIEDSWQVLNNEPAETYMLDAIHPNSAGYSLIGSFIAQWILGSNLYTSCTNKQVSDEYGGILGYSIVKRNGMLFVKGKLTLRNHIYTADSTLFTIEAACGAPIPLATTITAGVVEARQLYIDGNGNIKCNANIGDIDILFAGYYPMYPTYPI